MSDTVYPEVRVASVCAVNSQGKVLFGLRRDMGLFTLPGGHLNDGEAPVRGAVRELLEEAGLTPTEITFLGEGLVEADGKTLRIFCFKMTADGVPTSVNDPDKEVSVWQWVDCVDGIPANIFDHLYSPNNVVLKYCGLQRGVIVDDSYDTLRRESSQMSELQKAFSSANHPRDESGQFISTDAVGHENDPDDEDFTEAEGEVPSEHELFERAKESVAFRIKVGRPFKSAEDMKQKLGYEWPTDPLKQKELLEISGLQKGEEKEGRLSDTAQWIEMQLAEEGKQAHGLAKEEPNLTKFHKGFKNAPHGPNAQFLKYLIHRIERKDLYDSNPQAQDEHFDNSNAVARVMAQRDGHANVKSAAELGRMLHANIHLVDHALHHKAEVEKQLKPHSVMIDGQPHVALARYLDAKTTKRTPDPVLSSYSHKLFAPGESPVGPGKRPHKHFIPLKNIWASYDMLPKEASFYKSPQYGVGTQHEMLVSPDHPHVPASQADFDKQGDLVSHVPKAHIIDAHKQANAKPEMRLAASELEQLWDKLEKGEDTLVYITWDGDSIGKLVGRAELEDDADLIREISTKIDAGNAVFKRWCDENNGEVINVGGDEGRIAVDALYVPQLEKLCEKYHKASDATVSVGIGYTLSHSAKALMVAKLRGKDQVVTYSPDMADEIQEAVDAHDALDAGGKEIEEYLKAELGDQHALALKSISRMKPEHQQMATDWFHFTQGHTTQRPQVTPALERHLARFGVVDPAGYPYTETGRDMQRPIGGKKVFNQQPDALKQHKQNNNSLDYNLPFQRAELGAAPLHNTVEGFMGGLKALPKGTPARGKFITSHMNHAPFLSALQAHPQGPQIHSMLTQHLNSAANAGFRPGTAVATIKSELSKNKTSPVFPKLGVPDNRRETLLATRPQAMLQNKLAIHNAYQQQKFKSSSPQTIRIKPIFGESKDAMYERGEKTSEALFNRRKFGDNKGSFTHPDYKNDMKQTVKMTNNVFGSSSVMKPSIASYALQNKDRLDAGMARQTNQSDLATMLHEDFHNVMNRTRMRYGHQGQANLAQNLMTHLKGKDERAYHQLTDYVKQRTGMEPDDRSYNEEHIAHLMNYLNDPGVRRNYLHNSTQWIDPGEQAQAKRQIDQRMKSAYRHIVHGALSADPTWVLDPAHKDQAAEHAKHNPLITQPAATAKSEASYDNSSDTMIAKGLKGALAGAMMLGAAAHAGNPAPKVSQAHNTPQAQTQQQPSWNKEGLHHEMYPLGKLESNNGANLNHVPSKNGPFHTAFGPLGFKPSSAFEEFKTSPRLQQKYQGNDNADTFLKTFQENPTFYNEIASHHWNRLKKFAGGDAARAAYGWRWGPGKLQTAKPEEIDADPYVQRYKQITSPQIAMAKFAEEATDLYKAQHEQNWKGGDITIPRTGTADRKTYDKQYVKQLHNVFAQGGHTLKRLVVPTANINAFSANMPVNKERLNLYHKMARGGDRLPPIVVRRHSNNQFDIVDGSHRYAAAQKAGLHHLEGYEIIHPMEKSELDAKRVPKSYVGEFNGMSVFLVDGSYLRNNVDIEFCEGGNHERYNWIPKKEIWLENTGNKEDIASCAVHEFYEFTLMGDGMSYDEAHDKASAVEKKFRTEHEGQSVMLPDAVLWYDKRIEKA